MQNHCFYLTVDPACNYLLSGSAESVMGTPHPLPPHTPRTHIHTRTYKHVQIHIWSVFVPILQSWKCRHSEDTPGTIFSKQASQCLHCSVIMSTMTMWVYTKCHSGKRLPSGETASLLLRLTHSFTFTDDNAPVVFWLSVTGKRLLS